MSDIGIAEMSRTPEGIDVRAATSADAGHLSLIANATFLETYAGLIAAEALLAHCERAHTASAFAESLQSGSKAWLATLGGVPVGYALVGPSDLTAARSGDSELKKIYLLSRFHGQRIGDALLGDALLGAALEAARADQSGDAAGPARLLLGVKADNHRAIAFYEKHRFSKIGTRRFDVGGTLYDDCVMARDLTGN